MNLNWLTILTAVSGFLLGAVALIGLAARRSARELEDARKLSFAETDEIRAALADLQKQVAEMKRATPAQQASRQFVPAPALTADQRAEALGMLRSGMANDTVRSTLRLPYAETALLQKVDALLASTSPRK